MSVKKSRAYIYPSPVMKGDMINPYIENFVNSLEDNYVFLNRNAPSTSRGLFDMLNYINKVDIVFLNWPEEVPERKGGLIQTVFYICLIFYLRLRKVAVFWTLHNKESHVRKHIRTKKFLHRFTARNADYILTHSREGLSVLSGLIKPATPRVLFIHHPVSNPINIAYCENRIYDVLIWGTIAPYKGIEQFLQYVKSAGLGHLKILIAGKISDKKLQDVLFSYQTNNISFLNRFIASEEMETLFSQSKAILFTYLEYSILSSGALMDSLRYSSLIIGPHFGAFKDLKEEGLILTYNNYEQLNTILRNELANKPNVIKMQEFIKQNTWANFGKQVSAFIGSGKTKQGS